MNIDRINDFITLEKQDIISLFAPFDPSLEILDYSMLKDSMSNTGHMVKTSKRKYLLKLYSNTTDKIETAAYRYLKDKINVPELYFYDDRKDRFPFTYTITEFLDGITFINYVRTGKCYPVEKAYEIGKMCATVHQKVYECDALLDDKLNISGEIPNTHNKILHLLDGKPKQYLNPETIVKLREFIYKNAELFCRMEAESVLCHGDFGYGNIIISADKVYFIDFEFAYSGSRYHDIGHFFRKKGAGSYQRQYL